MNDTLVIVGIFYDGYYDLWEDFLELFYRNWQSSPFKLYIVNNTKELDFEKNYPVKVIHAGENAEYSKKIQVALEHINSEYYLLLLDDFFFSKKISSDVLNQVIHYIKDNDVSYYRMNIPDFDLNNLEYDIVKNISTKDEYTLTCQPSIWERNFLTECIGKENYNAWIFEGIYSFSKVAHSDDFLKKCIVDYSNPLGIRHGAVQGKMLPNVYRDISDTMYEFKTKRAMLSKKDFFNYKLKKFLKRYFPNLSKILARKLKLKSSVLIKYEKEIYNFMEKMSIK